MVTPKTDHVIARTGFTLRWALISLEIFATSFCQKVSPSERGDPSSGTMLCYDKSGPSSCITFMKRLEPGQKYQLLGQKASISPG